SFGYDATFRHRTAAVDGAGRTTLWQYDTATGELLAVTAGAGSGSAATSSYSWSAGLLVAEADPDGNVYSFRYKPGRQRVASEESDATGGVVYNEATAYDSAGNPSSATEGVGAASPRTAYTTFDALGRLVREVDPAGITTSAAYLPAGLVSSETDGNG